MNENEKDLPEEEIEEELPAEIEEEEEVEEENEEELPAEDVDGAFEEDFDEESDEDTDEEEESEPDPEPEKKEEPESEKPTAAEKVSDADRRYNRLLRDTRRALEALGIKTGDNEETVAEIVKLAAEQKGKSVEEYNKESDEEDEFLEYKRQKEINAKSAEDAAWEERLKKDLADIQAEFPEARKYTNIGQFPNWKRFGELMDTGRMSAVEAFKLSHPAEADAKIVAGVKQASINDTKKHLTSNVPKRTKSAEGHIPEREMETFREMFPDLDDYEIRKLYRKSTK